jgi:hypothetical protein
MRTLAEVQKAAREAQALIRVLVDIGGHSGPTENFAEKDATDWFEEMKRKDVSSISSGLLRLTQDTDDETGKGTGWFKLYVQVA